jgi:hypothetical protein
MKPGADNLPVMVRRIVPVMSIAAASLVMTGCTLTTDIEPESITAPPTTFGPDCTVSELLVPSCGIWLGSSLPSADGEGDVAAGLDEYEAKARNQPDILHFFQRGPKGFPTSSQIAAAERPGRPRSLLYFSWKPAPNLTWRQIADGDADAAIAAVALQLVQYPHRMFFTVHHEPENDVVRSEGSGMTPTDYVDMYRHVVGRLRSLGLDHLVFVMVYMGFERWADMVDDLYPGDDVVDWIGYDPYGFEAQTDFAALLNRPNPDIGWPGFYTWATQKSDKPIMVAEWGFDLTANPDAADVLADAPAILEAQFPRIKALVYWNSIGRRINARLDQPGAAAARFAAAFADMAADPLFNSTSTAAAP